MSTTIRGISPSRAGATSIKIQRTRHRTRKVYADLDPAIYTQIQTFSLTLPSKKMNAAVKEIIHEWLQARQQPPTSKAKKPKRQPLTPPLPLVYS